MFSMKNAALVGLAAADRTLFAPVAAPYGQVAPAYEPAVASAYALSADAFAQPVEFVQPVQPQSSDSQTWLWAGAGALALVGAYAARVSAAPSPVATLDEEDLESARIATLGVGGMAGKKKEEEQGGGLLAFLMKGRKEVAGSKVQYGALELLSGVTRPAADDPSVLAGRFKVAYDTRTRAAPKKVAKKAAPKSGGNVGFRSKNPSTNLYK